MNRYLFDIRQDYKQVNRRNTTTTAVLLLAGNDPRYLDETERTWCALLEVNGHSLLHCAVTRLLQVGFRNVILVTGQTTRAVQAVEQMPGVQVLYDALFADLGSMFALHKAAPLIPSYPFVLVESGLLFDSRLALLARTLPSASGALVSASSKETSTVFAAGVNQRLLGLYTGSVQEMAENAEIFASLGMYKISRQLFAQMLALAAGLAYTHPFLDYVECINEIATQSEISMAPVPDLPWTNVRNRAEAIWALQSLNPHIMRQENHPQPGYSMK